MILVPSTRTAHAFSSASRRAQQSDGAGVSPLRLAAPEFSKPKAGDAEPSANWGWLFTVLGSNPVYGCAGINRHVVEDETGAVRSAGTPFTR